MQLGGLEEKYLCKQSDYVKSLQHAMIKQLASLILQ